MLIQYKDLADKVQRLFEDLDSGYNSPKHLCTIIEKHFISKYKFKLKVGYRNKGESYYDFFIILNEKTHTLFQMLL